MNRVLVVQGAMQAIWFTCVLGGAAGTSWPGILAAGVWISLHLRLHPSPRSELTLIALAGALGAVADVFLIQVGELQYTGAEASAMVGPVWVVALWMAWSTCLNVSFSWLRERLFVAALLGVIFGPLAYQAGRRLGAVRFEPSGAEPLLALGLVWGVAIPLLVKLAERFAVETGSEPTPDS